jgi:PKD repeat protein
MKPGMETVLSGGNPKPILPAANFSANVTSGYAPLSVLFTDLSQNATSRSWDIDNKDRSTLPMQALSMFTLTKELIQLI